MERGSKDRTLVGRREGVKIELWQNGERAYRQNYGRTERESIDRIREGRIEGVQTEQWQDGERDFK